MFCQGTYVDNARNRFLGRVGLPYGTAVESSGWRGDNWSSSAGSSPGSVTSVKTYVGSAENRRLGRVGMEHGTAVHTRSTHPNSSGSSLTNEKPVKSYVDIAQNRKLGRVGMIHGTAVHSKSSSACSYPSSVTSVKTYVDNAENRRLGRVGMEHGTAVHSRSTHPNSSGSSLTSETSVKTYVDNAQNRKLGRVGMIHGTAVHSKSSSACSSPGSVTSVKTYVDNAENRRLGRVGMEHGTAVHSGSTHPNSSGSSLTSETSVKTYVDNAQNRKLGRVGIVHGTAVHSKPPKRVYVDNAFNRKHNRVGLPLGSAPISRKNEVYQDNAVNRHLGRVGKPMGSCPVEKKELSQLRKILEDYQNKDGDIPAAIEEMYENEDPYIRDEIEHVMQFQYREQFITEMQEEYEHEMWDPHEQTPASVIESCRGNIIKYGDLQIIKTIGHGAFGEVYAAVWNNGEVVAVKKMHFQNLTKARRQQFVNEVGIFCQLHHRNIACFIGVCIGPPNFAMVMEFMDMSLFHAIHIEKVDFDTMSKINITKNVTDGLDHLHEKKIAHCDLKTQNVLLNNVPGTGSCNKPKPVLAKLTDFGLSTMKASIETSSSANHGIRGTPRYAAPEVLRGKRLEFHEQLMKADVYSLGLVIFELAVEKIPFNNLSLTQLIKQVGKGGLTPKPSGGLKLDKFVKEQLDKCFSFDPDLRPTANEMAHAAQGITSLVEEAEGQSMRSN